jgi:hypothetical protein
MAKKEKDIFEGPKEHQDIIIDKIKNIFNKKADVSTDKEAGTNTYAKDNQAAIKKLKG